MKTGTVKFFNEEKGWGFLTPDDGSKDIFVHHSSSNIKMHEGDKVQFEVNDSPRGPKAVNVVVIQ
jgi:cold shock protein